MSKIKIYYKTEGNIIFPDERMLTWGPFYFHSETKAKEKMEDVLKDITEWCNGEDSSLNIAPTNVIRCYGGTQIVWVKTFEGFKDIIKSEFPDIIFFDHDLGNGESGKDCANFLVEYCMDNNIDVPQCYSQSSNPVGRENILSYIENYKQTKQ